MALGISQILIFGNPISGMGRGLAIAQRLADAASSAGLDARLFLDHPSAVPSDWIPPGQDGAVIVIGGDGSLRCVVDRLLQAQIAELPQILLVPLGTANLMARHLGSRWRPDRIEQEVLKALRFGPRRKIDLALANGKAMLAVGGVGFDARVIHELSARRRGPITYADYLAPTLKSLAGYRFHPITVTVDGRPIWTGDPAILFAGNIPEYGAGFSVTPEARSDDGLLDLCLLPCRTWTDLFDLGVLCGSRQQAHSPKSIYLRGKHIHVASDQPLPVQVDGDAGGFTPVTFDLPERQLTFIVPARSE